MAKLKDRKINLKVLSENSNKMGKTHKVDQSDIIDKSPEKEVSLEKNKLRNKKRKKYQTTEVEAIESSAGVENGHNGRVNREEESTKRKLKKKRTKKDKKSPVDEVNTEGENYPKQGNGLIRGELRKANKKNKNHMQTESESRLQKRDDEEDEVHQISSGDEDIDKGMKKWIMEYHQQRPGLKELQERIDDFITAHEEKEEQERQEREARAAEDGWTVVTHHKGRKKTTDAETGVAVGSVTQAAVLGKMANKKHKDVGLDFYRFQKREAQKNEIMMLQSKFEQDKKRIQQLRAARKFRPY